MIFERLAATSLALLLTSTALAAFPDCTKGPLSSNGVCDQSLSPAERATALIKLFTLEEKLNNTGSTAPGVPRIGLPSYQWWQEALHGIATNNPGVHFSAEGEFSYATSFPQPILMAAAFDDDLIHEVATVVSTEARAFSNAGRSGLDFWTPNINPFRDPRWGRGQETPGEDPFHISSYVKSLIAGLQGGEDPKYKKVVATCKHFAGYDLENWHETKRYDMDANITMQDLGEYFTPSFQSCARDAKAGSFMCTYSALNGIPTCADSWLLGDLLRDHWNWTAENQYVTSDCDSIQNVYAPHHYAASPAEAAALSLKAGTDLNCGQYYQLHLPQAYTEGMINDLDLDTALIRQYTALVRLGYFDSADEQPYRSINWSNVSTPAAEHLAYKAALKGMTLLKNDGTLPLSLPDQTDGSPDKLTDASKKNLSIALIGDWANATTQMQGNYYGIAPYLISPLQALQNISGVTVNYARGVAGQGDPTTNAWIPVFQAASDSDIIIFIDGIDNTVESEGLDRETIDWTGIQLDIIDELSGLGKKMVVVQMGGGSLDNSPLIANENINAILWGGYPGQAGGRAIIDTVFGVNSPAGRRTVTEYPASYVSVPMTDMNLRPDGRLNPGRTYKWYNGTANFPFGFGLSYTTFNASVALEDSSSTFDTEEMVRGCGATYLDLCPFTTLHASVTNTGNVSSDYAALAFISGDYGPEPRPLKELVAYTKLHNIKAGETQNAMLNLTLGSLSRWDESGRRFIYPGSYRIAVDTMPELGEVRFRVTGSKVMLDELPARRPS